MNRGQGKCPVPANVSDLMIDLHSGQVFTKIERSIEFRGDSFSLAIDNEIFASLAHSRHATLEMTGVAEQWRDHDIPADIRIAPFTILLHHTNPSAILAHYYRRLWSING